MNYFLLHLSSHFYAIFNMTIIKKLIRLLFVKEIEAIIILNMNLFVINKIFKNKLVLEYIYPHKIVHSVVRVAQGFYCRRFLSCLLLMKPTITDPNCA